MIITRFGERQETILQQISIGGCFTEWEENIYTGDEFRIEIELPNGNRLPLRCKALYRFDDTGIGVKFTDISQFEQELISKIISHRMEMEGLPEHISPFEQPRIYVEDTEPQPAHPQDERAEREELLEKIMSGNEV